MSRLIKKTIAFPDGVTVAVAGGFASVKGAKGELKVAVPDGVTVTVAGKEVQVAGGGSAQAGT
ncbi:MAG TPA: 50S ribosomal protein L6, partial [Candidatus Paceibacterota bacterium]|nr:50S ribosomal protein L6 [Candidatus Paceibacterota bacterium]